MRVRSSDLKHHRQSGQATLEMVLVLVVGMLVALGLLYRFNMAFKKYTIEMYGTYYRCLLETGELPGVGSVCKDKKTRFDIANGRDLIVNTPGSAGGSSGTSGSGSSGGSGSGGSGTKGSGSTPKNGSQTGTSKNPDGSSGSKSGSTAKNGSGSGSGGSGDSGDGSGSGGRPAESVGGSTQGSGGGSSSSIGRLRNSGRSRSTAVGNAGGSGAGAEGAEKPEPLSTYSSSSGSHSDLDALRRGRTKMDFKMEGGEYQRAETVATTAVSASNMKAAEKAGDSLRPRKAIEPENRKPAAKLEENKESGFEFGRIFRMFMIFGIIVAIVVFLGGQILQISKSGEK